MRRAGEAGVSLGGKRRSRSDGKGGGSSAWRPTLQTARQTSPKAGGGGEKQMKEMQAVLGRRWNSIERLYLQMEDVILGIQVDAHGFLLDGHDGEAHIDAAMELSLFQLRETGSEWVYLSTRGPKKKLK